MSEPDNRSRYREIMNLGYLDLPKIRIEKFNDNEAFADSLRTQYSEYISKDNNGKDILTQLEKDPRVKKLDGCLISKGYASSAFDLNKLAMWFSWAINEFGLDTAKQNLDRFLDSEMIPVLSALWVLGIGLESSITLRNGIRIVPIEDMPDSSEKEFFLQSEFKTVPRKQKSPKAAIVLESKVLKVTPNDSLCEISEEDRPFMESHLRLDEVALLLNLVQDVSCIPHLSTSYTLSEMPFGIFGPSSFGVFHHDILGRNFTNLQSNSISDINLLLESFNKLDQKTKKKFTSILSRLSQSKRREQIEDKMLDLGIALEMALLDDNSNNDQLALMFRLRGSWLLGKNYAERNDIYKKLNQIYKHRSQVAHSGVLEGNKEEKIKLVQEKFSDYSNLAEKIIAKILHLGSPAWSKIILGGE